MTERCCSIIIVSSTFTQRRGDGWPPGWGHLFPTPLPFTTTSDNSIPHQSFNPYYLQLNRNVSMVLNEYLIGEAEPSPPWSRIVETYPRTITQDSSHLRVGRAGCKLKLVSSSLGRCVGRSRFNDKVLFNTHMVQHFPSEV